MTEYEERRSLVSGGIYRFEAAPAGSGWRDIMDFRHDDPVGIPKENVRFVSDHIAYVFMGWKYAVTTDGGQTWSVWDGTKKLRAYCCDFDAIRAVTIAQDGSGRMTLHSSAKPEILSLTTKDFGQHWSM